MSTNFRFVARNDLFLNACQCCYSQLTNGDDGRQGETTDKLILSERPVIVVWRHHNGTVQYST